MNTVTVRDLVIGEGIPKICVPVTAETRASIREQARAVMQLPADIVEWRADYYQGLNDEGLMLSVIRDLRDILGSKPLLVTIRTSSEGGEASIDPAEYAAANLIAARSGLADMIDVEVFSHDDPGRLIADIHDAGAAVLASNHDFSSTPSGDEIIRRLTLMQDLGADIVKIAVMPRSISDVTVLLSAADEMRSYHDNTPVVTISMSDAGIVSRLTGELLGSAITFGAGPQASAPGQIPADELKELLSKIHRRI